MREILRKHPPIILAGATNDQTKFGNIIFRDLISKGFPLYPVNPRATTIEGHPAWKSVSALQELPEFPELKSGILVLVLPPTIAWQTVKEAIQTGIRRLWFQPGSFTREQIEELVWDPLHLEIVAGPCIMMETGATGT